METSDNRSISEPNFIDNELSLQLKEAVALGVPSKYIILKDGRYFNVLGEIINLIPTDISLIDLYNLFPTILPEDLAMIYAQYVKEISINQIIENINNFYNLLNQNLNNQSTKANLSKKQIGLSPIRDRTELNLFINDWRKRYSDELESDRQKLEEILIIQDELGKYEPLEYSPLIVTSNILYIKMKKKDGSTVSLDDSYEIFDLSKPNITLPYIKWNSNIVSFNNNQNINTNVSLYKLYTGLRQEDRLDFSKVIPSITKEINFIFSVWKGVEENENDLLRNKHELTKESFLKATYNLDLLKIKIPLEGEDDNGRQRILNRIINTFPLEIDTVKENRISGEFYIYDIEINDLLLAHMVLNLELFNIYLFIQESSSSVAMKKKNLKVYFRSISGLSKENSLNYSVAFSIQQLYAKGGENIHIQQNIQKKENTFLSRKLETNEPYIKITITSAESIETANSFIYIITRLLSAYKENINNPDPQDNLLQFYLSWIPEFSSLRETETVRKTTRESNSKIHRLKQAAPDLFISDYARKCLCQFQPIIIEENEIEEWQNKMFNYKGRDMKRQVMAFPPDNPKWYFVCPNDKYPFPGVKKNNLANMEKYPGLPCCFVNNQIDSIKSKYNRIFYPTDENNVVRRRKEQTKTESEDEFSSEEESSLYSSSLLSSSASTYSQTKLIETHIIRTNKIIGLGRYGILPSSIIQLLAYPSTESGTIYRKGIQRSPNSLLHCISLAVQDPNYLSLNNREKEEYVQAVRRQMAEKIQPAVCKSELYDFTEEQIRQSLNELDTFLDPNLYYRAIEEFYNINIFVFSPSANEEKRLKNKEDSTGHLELPRFKLFPVRTPRRERMNVLVYRTFGSESDALTYPQCELIIQRIENLEEQMDKGVFDRRIFDRIYPAFLQVNKTLTWELIQESSESENIDVLTRQNIYSRINFRELYKNIKAQYIDEYGKMRGLYFNDFMIIFPSSSPENLPTRTNILRGKIRDVLHNFRLSDLSKSYRLSDLSKSYGLSEKSEKNVNRLPTAYSVNNDLITGLWYPLLDLDYGLYIPIIPIRKEELPLDNLIMGPNNPLGEGVGNNITARIIKLRRDLNFIFQTVKWLYSLYYLSLNVRFDNNTLEETLRNFFDRYITIGNEGGDSSTIYDFTNIGRKYPDLSFIIDPKDRINAGIEEMKKKIPSLFSKNKIYLYSQRFADGLFYTLKQNIEQYYFNFTTHLSIQRESLSEQDFLQYPGVTLFLSTHDLNTWLTSFHNYTDILMTIKIADAMKTDPFLYLAADGHIYLIQNVTEGNMSRAINVAYYWQKYKVNPGIKTPEYSNEMEFPPYVLYSISPANTIIPTENHAGDDLDYLSILRYNAFAYAAMLRLL
jgi:hypothetical protein